MSVLKKINNNPDPYRILIVDTKLMSKHFGNKVWDNFDGPNGVLGEHIKISLGCLIDLLEEIGIIKISIY